MIYYIERCLRIEFMTLGVFTKKEILMNFFLIAYSKFKGEKITKGD